MNFIDFEQQSKGKKGWASTNSDFCVLKGMLLCKKRRRNYSEEKVCLMIAAAN